MDDGKRLDSPGEPGSEEPFSPAPGTAPRMQANLLSEWKFPVVLACSFYAAMALLAGLWRLWWDGALPWSAPGVEPATLPVRLGAGVATGLAGVALSRWWIGRSELGSRLSDELGRMLGPMAAGTAWGLAAISALGEELLFRGAAQPAIGWLLASALFAAVHFLPGPGLWIWMLYAFGAGLLLSALFQWTGDVVAPVTAHAVLNGVNLSWLGRRNRERAPAADQRRVTRARRGRPR